MLNCPIGGDRFLDSVLSRHCSEGLEMMRALLVPQCSAQLGEQYLGLHWWIRCAVWTDCLEG